MSGWKEVKLRGVGFVPLTNLCRMCCCYRNAGRCRQPVCAVSDVFVPTWRSDVHADCLSASPVHDDVSPRSGRGGSGRGRRVRAPAARLPAAGVVCRVVGGRGRRQRRRAEPATFRGGATRGAEQPRTHAGRERRIISLDLRRTQLSRASGNRTVEMGRAGNGAECRHSMDVIPRVTRGVGGLSISNIFPTC